MVMMLMKVVMMTDEIERETEPEVHHNYIQFNGHVKSPQGKTECVT